MPASTSAIPIHCKAAGNVPCDGVRSETHDWRCSRDRRHDAHGADREPAIERSQADESGDSRTDGRQQPSTPGNASRATSTQSRTPTRPIAWEIASTAMTARRRAASPPRKSPTPHHRAPPSARTAANAQSPTGRVAACASSWFAW